jgi:hypothetical protein
MIDFGVGVALKKQNELEKKFEKYNIKRVTSKKNS